MGVAMLVVCPLFVIKEINGKAEAWCWVKGEPRNVMEESALVGSVLLGRAIIPADTFVDGPTSGQHIGPGPFFGRVPPFVDKQPVQGISAIVALKDGFFLAMSDNGFGSKANSPDYLLAVYKIRPNFADGTVEIEDMIRLRDPNNRINFPIQNQGTAMRYLTGADFDLESFQ
ncbi:esterase-like activity of phytase family protein, partial [Thermodesulfovibrionales bacterium]|nr:esterase-like activity of phytase family protein [Thermodesulfovibrionales bacterium]